MGSQTPQIEKDEKTQKPFLSGTEDEQASTTTILKLLDELYNIRLIQKLCRPLSHAKKERFVNKFLKKLDEIHERMHKMKAQSIEYERRYNEGRITRQRKKNWEEQLQKVREKYDEILLEGSLRHYKKVMKLNRLHKPFQAINTSNWVKRMSFIKKKEVKCCSCFHMMF